METMTASTSWKRVTALALVVLMAHAPSAFAGHLLDSALQAAAEVTARQAQPAEAEAAVARSLARPAETRAAAMQAPPGDGDRGGSRKVWAVIAAGVGIGLAMMVIDRKVEDSTPSTHRERRDGCTLFCS
jgi:hypothetical protein